MTSESTKLFACGHLAVEVSGPSDILAEMSRETQPFFDSDGSVHEAVLRLAIEREAPAKELEAKLREPGGTLAVDTSLYAHLKSTGTRWDLPDGWLVRIDATGSVFEFHRTRGATLRQPNAELATRDAIRLVKSILTIAAEHAGAVQLHASAVSTEEGAVVLIGDMWQGKTTLLLELLAEFAVDQISCDTVVLRAVDDRLHVWGWPSPFSVSHGTLVDHRQLASLLPPERQGVPYDTLWREGRKTVLSSSDVTARFGAKLVPTASLLAACVLVEFAPQAHTRLERVVDVAAVRAALHRMYLGSRDPIYHNWHRWLTASDELLEANITTTAERLASSVPIYRMVWAPGPRSLLKRVPALARAHPVLSAHRLFENE